MARRRSKQGERDPREAGIRKLLFKALVEEWLGYPYSEASERLTRSERGRVNRAVAELRAVGVDDPDEIHRRALIYRLRFPGCHLTPQALTANWTVCGDLPPSLLSGEKGVISWAKVAAETVEREAERLLVFVEAGGIPSFASSLSDREREVVAFWLHLEKEYRAGAMIPERVRTLDVLRRWILSRREEAVPVPHDVEQLMHFYRHTLGWRPAPLFQPPDRRPRRPSMRWIDQE